LFFFLRKKREKRANTNKKRGRRSFKVELN